MSEEQSEQMQIRSKRPIKNNPFLVRDKKGQGQETEKIHSVHVANRMECDDPMCRATHAGHSPFRHSVSCSKHQSKQNKRALDLDSASDRPPQAEVFEKHDSSTSLPPGKADIIHRHHSAGFHSSHHIAEHLSSAVGRNAYDLLKRPNQKMIQHASSKELRPYLEPLTKPKSVTQIDSFHWTPDVVPPGHPSRSSNGKQQRSQTPKVATNVPDHWLPGTVNGNTTHDAADPMSGEGEHSEVRNESNLSLRDDPPKVRLASTSPWLKNPGKEAANAAAPLHHINTKSHQAHEHDHGYLSGVAAGGWKAHAGIRSASPARRADIQKDSNSLRFFGGSSQESDSPFPSTFNVTQHQDLQNRLDPRHQDHTRSRSNYEGKSQGEQHLSSTRMHDSTSTMLNVPEPLHMTPKIRIDPPRREHRDAPMSDEAFEHSETKSFVEQSSEPEIAKPTPIAPPNHECTWKERYLALTAEIRQLKAEMSTRASLKGSGILTPNYGQHEDDFDLLEVSIILHFRDRDDIVINTDVVRDAEPGN
ncbi:hypothetical protein E0Z10_g4344 [Xylaria hypoxylon]|uniref:Uncharacterized protein n=1 Tax=Xylaria hypoxylon TaxID=37992 RepID=A0A4Z0Z0Z2_9PEZI|nr:hypothetical protein E0Z10_g4344 [Xylaria hypoxylon]